MERLIKLVATLAFLLYAGMAQAETPPPAPLSPSQLQSVADSVAAALSKRLDHSADLSAPSAVTVDGKPAGSSDQGMGEYRTEQSIIRFFRSTADIVSQLPALLAVLRGIPGALQPPAGGDRNLLGFGLALLVAMAGALAPGLIVMWLFRSWRSGLERLAAQSGRLLPIGLIALLDGVTLLAVGFSAYLIAAIWFSDASLQSGLGASILGCLFFGCLYMFPFALCFRPLTPQARLADIDDADARAIILSIAACVVPLLLARIVLRFVLAMGAPPEIIACAQVISAILIIGVFVAAGIVVRRPVTRWLTTLLAGPSRNPGLVPLARYWLAVAIPLYLLLGATQILGVTRGQSTVSAAVILSVTVILVLLMLETLTHRVTTARARSAPSARQHSPRAADTLMRCTRVAIVIAAGLFIAEAWIAEVPALTGDGSIPRFLQSLPSVGLTLLLAYCAWEGFNYAASPYMPTAGQRLGYSPGGRTGIPVAERSRSATLTPLLRAATTTLICVLATLTVLAQVGVNVTALIAGASVVGLAISFGSQTLVKDIVSGVFYLFDDAFRVGEYIESGSIKGTVDGFTLRSLRLRHENGQIHTLPFGQLGQITNFSRDWTTAKFNLRFGRNIDPENLRRVVQAIGQDMRADPQWADEILVPLQMEGIADVTDDALIVRFEITVKPIRPMMVQREALKLLLKGCDEAGIEFANAAKTSKPPAPPTAETITVENPAKAAMPTAVTR